MMTLWHKHNKQLLMQIWSIGPSLEGKHFGTKESLYNIRLLLEEGSGIACSNPLTGKLLFTRIQTSLPLNCYSKSAKLRFLFFPWAVATAVTAPELKTELLQDIISLFCNSESSARHSHLWLPNPQHILLLEGCWESQATPPNPSRKYPNI